MIDFHYWPTPNGWKVAIMLEECGLPYDVKLVNIGKGEQFSPEFLSISPNNRMPAIVDHDPPAGWQDGSNEHSAAEAQSDHSASTNGTPAAMVPATGLAPVTVFESGAILLYLAEKTARFLPADARGRKEAWEWLFWQVGNLGPMAGQLSHFVNYAEGKHPYSHQRYADEYHRCLGVLERRLAERDYLLGDYSIADMATWPWVLIAKPLGQPLDEFPRVTAWRQRIKERPAVQAGVNLARQHRRAAAPDEKERQILFGQRGSPSG